MPTRRQLQQMRETEFEYPETRREDDPLYKKTTLTMQQEQHSDALPHPPTFDQMVGMIKKLFTDSLEQTKMFTAEEIEAGWVRYKALNHLYQDEPGNQSAGTWVKASERLPWHKAHWNTGKLGSDENSFPVRMNGRYSMGDIYDQAGKGECEIPMISVRGVGDVYSDQFHLLEWLDQDTLPDNKDREIAFALWCSDNFLYVEKGRWDGANDETYNTGQLHELWEISLTNKP